MSAGRDCLTCAHHQYLVSFEQTVCLHPKVAVYSDVNKRLIGVNASTIRFSATCLGAPQCGPEGIWWIPQEASR